MVVKEYENAQSFLLQYEKLMLEQEVISQLILYNAYHNLSTKVNKDCFFGAVINEEVAILLFCNVAPYNLVVYAASPQYQKEAVETLADYIYSHHIAINGINAKYEICQSFILQYKNEANAVFTEKFGMDIMELRKLNDIQLVEGKSRNALPSEAKLVTDWMISFQLEAMASEMDYEEALNNVINYIEHHKVFVYENTRKKLVSMAIAARQLIHGVAINYVYTPEEHRGKGYAAANIYYMCKYYLDNGNDYCALFADKKSQISYRAYENVGFQVLEDNYDYKLIISQ